jgi:uncharacterized protein (TIGR03067 family)
MPITQDTTTTEKDVVDSLQGKWRVVYSELDGEMTPVDEFSTIVLENRGYNFFVEKRGEIAYEGRFSINVTNTPHELVYIYTKASRETFLGGPRVGIFQLVGNTFKSCLGMIGQRPPKDFSTFSNSNAVLAIHQRLSKDGKIDPRRLPPGRDPAEIVW